MSRPSLFAATIGLVLSAGVASAQGGNGSGAAPPPAPEVGTVAPDFTAPWADASGPKAKDLHLADLKGKVVVLAFYPGDRTGGCTIELSKFRDDYEKIFIDKSGKEVVVLPASYDPIDSHVSWARDAKFPFAMISDPPQKVATLYGSNGTGAMMRRTVFVIGRDGKIAYRNLRFNVNSQQAYDDLAAEVAKALK